MKTFSILFTLNSFFVFFIFTGTAVTQWLLNSDKISSESADYYFSVFSTLAIFLCISTFFNFVIGVKYGYIVF